AELANVGLDLSIHRADDNPADDIIEPDLALDAVDLDVAGDAGAGDVAAPGVLNDDRRIAGNGKPIIDALAPVLCGRVDCHDVVLFAERETRGGGELPQVIFSRFVGDFDVGPDGDVGRVGSLALECAAAEADFDCAGFRGVGELDRVGGLIGPRGSAEQNRDDRG